MGINSRYVSVTRFSKSTLRGSSKGAAFALVLISFLQVVAVELTDAEVESVLTSIEPVSNSDDPLAEVSNEQGSPKKDETPPAPKPPAEEKKTVSSVLTQYTKSLGITGPEISSESVKKLEPKPVSLSSGELFIEEFCGVNGLIWFQHKGTLFVDALSDTERETTTVDIDLARNAIDRMVKSGTLHPPKKGKTYNGYVNRGGNSVTLLGEKGEHALIQGHEEFINFIKVELGQSGASSSGGLVNDDLEILVLEFEHAWVTDVDFYQAIDSTSQLISAKGIYETFCHLAGNIMGETFMHKKGGDEEESAREVQSSLESAILSAGFDRNISDRRYIANGRVGSGNPDREAVMAEVIRQSVNSPNEETRRKLLEYERARLQIGVPASVERIAPADFNPIDYLKLLNRRQDASFSERSGTRSFESPEEMAERKIETDLEIKVGLMPDEARNAIIVVTPARHKDELIALAERLDQPPKMVEISVAVIDLNTTSGLDWGADFGISGIDEVTPGSRLSGVGSFNGGLLGRKESATKTTNGLFGENTNLGVKSAFTAANVVYGDPFSAASRIIGSSGVLNMRLQMLERSSDAKVLSRPSLLTLDGHKAVYYSNDATVVSATGEYNADLFQVNAPVAIEITPNVSEKGVITLDLVITDSAITPETNTKLPFIGESHIETNAMLVQGQSLLLGGRYRNRSEKKEARIPIVGKIPIIGLAFKDKNVEETRIQRLFMVTPKLVTYDYSKKSEKKN
jgi:type II secretory pathway component GspD/PulD (secretin)